MCFEAKGGASVIFHDSYAFLMYDCADVLRRARSRSGRGAMYDLILHSYREDFHHGQEMGLSFRRS
jgi:hypothetical protein